ncbi:hypothetical protein FGG78_26685 [Thioclava sp. BHET1]|nr:hypothetical protein FGG78_26685 [Thioclava sp. BHET1]
MHTNVTFQNKSLNPNVVFVGVFWDCPGTGLEDVLRFWFLIERCTYGLYRDFTLVHSDEAPKSIGAGAIAKDWQGLRIRNCVLNATFDQHARFVGPSKLRIAADPCRAIPARRLVFNTRLRSQELDLAGLASASVTMTGGQPGPASAPISFDSITHDGIRRIS